MKIEISPIENENVCLRLLTQTDLPLTLAWRNQERIRKWFFYSDLITPENHLAWFESYQVRDNDFVFIIEEAEADYRPVGQVSLYNINWSAKNAEFGRLMIGEPDAVGKGLARIATQLILNMAFRELGVEEVYLEVYAHNERALSFYKGIGFKITASQGNIVKMNFLEEQT